MSVSRWGIVQIVSVTEEAVKIRGTGTLWAPNRILTARHVVQDSTGAPVPNLHVRREDLERKFSMPVRATILWSGPEDLDDAKDLDVAVLEAPLHSGGEHPSPWDVFSDRDIGFHEAVSVQGYAEVNKNNPAKSLQNFTGTTHSCERGELLLAFVVPTESVDVSWHGLSGAAVVVGERIVAVVRSYDARFPVTRLQATPVARFLNNEGFRRATKLPPLRLERKPQKNIEWPKEPYPGLQPYEHPKLFRGRDDARDDILVQLDAGKLVVLLNAPSGIGKTSFLRAGLVPLLASRGRLSVIVSKPEEPCMLLNILDELARCPPGFDIADDGTSTFFEHLRHLRAEGAPPVFILDPFEGVMRDREKRLAMVGRILTETFARKGPSGQIPCQWILSYRHEFDGPVATWFTSLPEEMSRTEFLGRYDMKPMGTFANDVPDLEAATDVFYKIIDAPLHVDHKYPLRFPEDDARRLAAAFAAARCASADQLPLVSEFQAVLRHLITKATVAEDGIREVRVPDNVDALIANALNDYFKEEFERAFDEPFDSTARRRRALGLFALRDVAERLGPGDRVFVDVIKNNLADDGEDILHRLTKKARLLVEDRGKYDPRLYYVFPHERLPSIVSELFDVEAEKKNSTIEKELFKLYDRIPRLIDAHAQGFRWATELDDDEYLLIEQRRKDLPWGGNRVEWWAECTKHHERKVRRGKAIVMGVVVLLGVAIIGAGWFFVVSSGNTGVARIEQAQSYRDAARAYVDLRRFPWHEQAADTAMARWLVRWGVVAAMRGAWDEAMYWRLRALELADDDENRRELRYLETARKRSSSEPLAKASTLVFDRPSAHYATNDGDQVLEIRTVDDQSVMTLWDVRTSLQASDEMTISPGSIHFASGNQMIAVADEKQIVLIDRFSGVPLCAPTSWVPNDPVTQLEVSREGFLVFIQSNRNLRVWDAGNCKDAGMKKGLSDSHPLHGVSPTGDFLLLRNDAGNMELWSLAFLNTAPVWVDRRASSMEFLADGDWVAGQGMGSTVILRAKDGKTVCSIPEVTTRLDISPDGRFLLMSDNGSIRLWSIATETEVCAAVGQPLAISRAIPRLSASPRFSRDGRSAMILDHDAVHFVDVTAYGLIPRTTRRLGQRAYASDVWIAQPTHSTALNAHVLVQSATSLANPIGYWIETANPEPARERIEGQATALLETWHEILGIKERRFGIIERD